MMGAQEEEAEKWTDLTAGWEREGDETDDKGTFGGLFNQPPCGLLCHGLSFVIHSRPG